MGHLMRVWSIISGFIIGLSILILASFAFAQAPENTSIPIFDLGVRKQGQNYPFKLTAQNVNCDTVQDFEFEIDDTPWLGTPNGTKIPGLGPGQGRSIQASLDFTYMPAGVYFGHLTARCTSCGWFIFAACVENGQDIVLKVTVADPADIYNGANLVEPPNPFASLKPYQPSNIALNPPISNMDETLLTQENRRKLRNVRDRVKIAEANGIKARNVLLEARKKKSDCERELARLKAAMEAAKRNLGIAAQDVANADGAVQQAQKELTDFDADVRKAKIANDLAYQAVRTAMFARDHHGRTFGSGSQQFKASSKLLKDNQDKRRAAEKNLDAVKNSKNNRQTAVNRALQNARAAKASLQQAQTNANAATARYNAKARECKVLGIAKSDAEKNLDAAENTAKHAVGVANYEEGEAQKRADKARAEAKARGVRDLGKDLKKQRQKCKVLEAEWREKMRRMTGALKAYRQNGYYKSKDNKVKNPPTPSSLWNDYTQLGYNVFVETVATVGGAPTAGGPTMLLDVLMAGYGIAAIRQSELIPGTAAHGRSDGKELRDWLVENKFANADRNDKDARAVEEEMRNMKNDPNYMEKEIKRGIDLVEACKRKTTALAAKLEAARHGKK